MVGMETRKLNSRAAGRSRLTNWPAAMVDMEREVPGKTAESVWQRPIQMAWGRDICSTSWVLASRWEAQTSTAHMTMPPMSSARAMA
jgi:hypothetical protein